MANGGGDNRGNNAPNIQAIADRFLVPRRRNQNAAPTPARRIQAVRNATAAKRVLAMPQDSPSVCKILKVVKKCNNRGIKVHAQVLKLKDIVEENKALLEALRDGLNSKLPPTCTKLITESLLENTMNNEAGSKTILLPLAYNS